MARVPFYSILLCAVCVANDRFYYALVLYIMKLYWRIPSKMMHYSKVAFPGNHHNVAFHTVHNFCALWIHYSDVIMGAMASRIQPHGSLLNRLFGRRSKKTSKLHVTGLCAGNSPANGQFPAQMASNAKMFPFDDVIMCRLHLIVKLPIFFMIASLAMGQ